MKSKISQLVFIITFLSIPFITLPQTADEIIDKHIAAHGGAENWSRVEALKITGNFTAFSLEKDFFCYKTKSGFYYSDFFMGEMRVIESFDGIKGWTIDPWQEMEFARNLNSSENNALAQKAEFFTPFYNYKEKGYKVEYTGLDTVDGMEVFVLKLTRTNDRIETWYLNAETYLEYICHTDWVDFARDAPAETFFEDFRTVEGLVIPFFVERTFWQRDRILQIEKVEINPEVDPDLFAMPKREEIKKLEFLQGEWDVKVEVWTRRGTWYPMGNTSSSIEFVSTNLIRENISYERIYPISKTINYSWNDSYNQYRISDFNDLSSHLNIYEGEFKDTSFVYHNANISYGDSIPEGVLHFQYIISTVNADSFVVLRNSSADNGETWTPGDKFTYTRKEE